MSWSGLANNQMVSFNDVQTSPFTLLSGQSVVNSNQCMTKLNALTKYNLNATIMSSYSDSQLVPKNVWGTDISCVIGWSTINATHTTYRDGTTIPQVTSTASFSNLTTGAWCYYSNNSANEDIYGKLYNWYAVAGIYDTNSLNNPAYRKEFAPISYRVPSNTDWNNLFTCLGGNSIAGGKMKETGTTHWSSPNTDATNSSGFTGLPGGYLGIAGNGTYGFNSIQGSGDWWSLTDSSISTAYFCYLNYVSGVATLSSFSKSSGMSVRTIIDYSSVAWSCKINPGWFTTNATHSTYRDGTTIPQVTDETTWKNLTTGAWCYYDNNPANEAIYGKLYNGFAVKGIYDSASLADPLLRKEFAPTNTIVPTQDDWHTLSVCLGDTGLAGGPAKEVGTTHWTSPNTGATNESGFTALPGGMRAGFGAGFDFANLGTNAYWWSSTPRSSISSQLFIARVDNLSTTFATANYSQKSDGYSVRLINLTR
jgi:uncharacterized protein (TIGR02145 family)